MNYYLDFLTRKVLVQGIYENFTSAKENLFEYLMYSIEDHEHMLSEVTINKPLFEVILKSICSNYSNIIAILISVETERKISRCAKAILTVAFAESLSSDRRKNIILNEYIKLAHMFCETEVSMINKVLDKNFQITDSLFDITPEIV